MHLLIFSMLLNQLSSYHLLLSIIPNEVNQTFLHFVYKKKRNTDSYLQITLPCHSTILSTCYSNKNRKKTHLQMAHCHVFTCLPSCSLYRTKCDDVNANMSGLTSSNLKTSECCCSCFSKTALSNNKPICSSLNSRPSNSFSAFTLYAKKRQHTQL